MTDVDPFAEPDPGIPRDGRGRPLIAPVKRDGTPNLTAKPVAYTRASTFAKALDDGAGLTTWKVRHAVLGIAIRPDLAAMAGAMGRNLNTLSDEDKRNLDAIIERAHDSSGGNEKADYGTAIHSLTEPGRDPFTPDRMAADVDAYLTACDEAGLEVIETETFVVNDALKVAGTFDHVHRLRDDIVLSDTVTIPAGTLVITDKKTGSLHIGQNAIQLAVYARAQKYDHVTGARTALDVSPLWGIVAHIPNSGASCTLYAVNLSDGWKGAKLALEVRAYRSTQRKLATKFHEVKPVEPTDPEPAAIATLAPVTVVEAPIAASLPAAVAAVAAQIEADRAAYDKALADAASANANLDDWGLPTVEAATALITETFDATDPIMDAIGKTKTGDECRELWKTTMQSTPGAWTNEHTAAVLARLEVVPQSAAA